MLEFVTKFMGVCTKHNCIQGNLSSSDDRLKARSCAFLQWLLEINTLSILVRQVICFGEARNECINPVLPDQSMAAISFAQNPGTTHTGEYWCKTCIPAIVTLHLLWWNMYIRE